MSLKKKDLLTTYTLQYLSNLASLNVVKQLWFVIIKKKMFICNYNGTFRYKNILLNFIINIITSTI